MSNLDIRLNRGSFHFRVKEIVERRENGPGGFPEMDIVDFNGKEHTISACDMSAAEFEKIKPGVVLKVDTKEEWSNLRII